MKNEINSKEKKKFIIQLPFDYKKAVLTQVRTGLSKPYAFIVEFNDGSRKFLKGPFKNYDSAEKPIICNGVKRSLASKYLHPIECEIKDYGDNLIFLECEELGYADLKSVADVPTKKDGICSVLKYDSNDVVPDPFEYLNDIKNENIHVWIEVFVNYCFRWVFGIKDNARRNFMLQRSTGKIYSVDETGIESVKHQNVWGGKKPNEQVCRMISAFVRSKHLDEILSEVERWKNYFDHITKNIIPLSIQVDGRLNNLLNHPIQVFDV